MGWTRRSYDALFEWGNAEKRESVKDVLRANGLDDVVVKLESAPSLEVWYRTTGEAAAAVGPRIVEKAAAAAEISLRVFARSMGRVGGSSRSDAKVAASRENGKLGGRPPKEKD